jgi:hypothetical protein
MFPVYNNNKFLDEVANEYKKNTNYIYEASPEQKKEYARRAYLKKKDKIKKEEVLDI